MAKVKPFRGVRPPREFVEQVASRPYDVLNSQEARAEAEGNPRSLYHIIKPEIDFVDGTDEHDPKVYDKAVENFKAFQNEAGSYRTTRNIIIYTRRPWTAAPSTASSWPPTLTTT